MGERYYTTLEMLAGMLLNRLEKLKSRRARILAVTRSMKMFHEIAAKEAKRDPVRAIGKPTRRR